MEEIWKDIKGYEGLYQVSNYGNVKSIKRCILLKQNTSSEYNQVRLCKNGIYKNKKIHRLVAEEFLPNINNYNCVNHIDENKRNNIVYNLEWCSKKYNCNYGKRNEKASKNNSKYKIVQKKKDGEIITIWENMWDLSHNLPYNKNVIRQCCKNKCRTAYGYKWEYIPK